MRVAIIENMAGTPYGQLGVALAEANAEVHVIRAYAGEPLPKDAGDYVARLIDPASNDAETEKLVNNANVVTSAYPVTRRILDALAALRADQVAKAAAKGEG